MFVVDGDTPACDDYPYAFPRVSPADWGWNAASLD
jgi:hypothetical protein